MSAEMTSSFSPRRKWRIGFNVMLASLAVLVAAVAVNYISNRIVFKRFFLSSRTQTELSPRTRGVLRSLTNRINITIYYDKEDALYDNVAALVNEYRLASRKVSVETVDYLHDVATAQKIKARYNLGSPNDKNLVIFDCVGAQSNRVKVVPGDTLGQYVMEPTPGAEAGKMDFQRRPTQFLGERMFTSALLEVLNSRPLKAYFVQGHTEPAIDDTSSQLGFAQLTNVLHQSYIAAEPLWIGTNAIPSDCNLLVILGPRTRLLDRELDQVEQYLLQGGRLLVGFDFFSINRDTGLETLLAKWGVNVSHSIIRDDDNTYTGKDIRVGKFARHPVVDPLVGSQLYIIQPRMISRIEPLQTADSPKVEEIAFSGPNAALTDNPGPAAAFPLMVAAEKSVPKGVAAERGSTRILVAGDSIFLGNVGITSLANSDFVSFAANWLLDRTVLLQGIGPQPVTEYRLFITRSQLQAVEWILLAAIPGGILLFGGFIWLRRRK